MNLYFSLKNSKVFVSAKWWKLGFKNSLGKSLFGLWSLDKVSMPK